MKDTLVMRKRASDNKYLHKDFHGALSCGIEYLRKHYGAAVVARYLKTFTKSYYAPLRQQIKKEGLKAIKKYFQKIYKNEGGMVEFKESKDKLIINVKKCPAISHMKSKKYSVSPLFCETTRIMNEAICEGAFIDSKLVKHDINRGRCLQIFVRRTS